MPSVVSPDGPRGEEHAELLLSVVSPEHAVDRRRAGLGGALVKVGTRHRRLGIYITTLFSEIAKIILWFDELPERSPLVCFSRRVFSYYKSSHYFLKKYVSAA